jgi:hypothetical protein
MPPRLNLADPEEKSLNLELSAESLNNYEPTFSQITEARYGQFTISDDLALGAMHAYDRTEPGNTFISEEQFKASDNYREGMTYGTGITERGMEIMARRQDAAQYNNYILERAKGAKNVFASSLGFAEATALDPVNLASLALPVPGLREMTALKAMAAQGAYGAAKAGIIKGAVQGAVGATYFEPLLMMNAAEFGEEYTFADSAQNILTNALIGGGLHLAGAGIKAGFKAGVSKFTRTDIPVEQFKEAVGKSTVEMHHGLIPDNEIIFREGEIIKAERAVQAEARGLEEQMAILEKELDGGAVTPVREEQIKQEMDVLADQRIAEITDYSLPKNLAGAKPRYNYGSKQYEKLNFESDVDKALFIVSQKSKSKRDADYRAFLKEKVGMSDAEIESRSALLRDNIKSLAKDSEGGVLEIPKSKAQAKTTEQIRTATQKKLQAKRDELQGINQTKQEIAARQKELAAQSNDKVMERDYLLGDMWNKAPDEPQPDFDVVKKTEEARAMIDSMAMSEFIPPEVKERLATEFTQLNTEQTSMSKAIEMAAFCFLKGGK